MFTVNIYAKPNATDLKMARLELVFHKQHYKSRARKLINVTGPIKDWDSKAQCFKSRNPDVMAKNKILMDLKIKYTKVAEEWDAEGREWSPVELSHAFDEEVNKKSTEKIKSISVAQYIDTLVAYNYARKRHKNGQMVDSSNNARTYERIKRRLTEFVKEKYNRSFATYFFKDITEQFLLDFMTYTQEKGAENGNKGGLTSKLRRIRAICHSAMKKGMYGARIDIFDCLGDAIKWPEYESKAVSSELLNKIECLDRSLFSVKEQLHLDLFLFSYYTGGMANVDTCNLTWDLVNLKDRRITYERIKFSKTAKPLLSDLSIAILKKYEGKGYGNYVFPVFTHKHDTTSKKTTRVKQISILVSRTLDKACQILGVTDENLTWYTARGSFISAMVDEGHNPYIVAEMAGNSPMMIYKHYYKNTNPEDVLNSMNKVFSDGKKQLSSQP